MTSEILANAAAPAREIAFIGGGNMARSLVGGLLARGWGASRIHVSDPTPSARDALAAEFGVGVHAVLTGPTDTDMTRGFDIPKASAESVARAIFDGVAGGEEDIFPDPMSRTVAQSWRASAAKALERENAAVLSMLSAKAA